MRKEYKDAIETAEMLIEIYEARFGGKSRGRFLIPKNVVREMSGRDILQGIITQKIIKAMSKLGYGMFTVGDFFAIVKNTAALKWRTVPIEITSLFLDNEDDEDDTEDYEVD